MQSLQAACARAASGEDASSHAGLDEAAGRKALDELCASWRNRPPEALGAISNAYGRWATDNIRRMQSPSATGAGAGGS